MVEISGKKRVLLGMSGGTDSAVSAIMLKKQGFEVEGVTFIFADNEKQNQQNISDAIKVAEKLKIKHHVLDLTQEFNKTVIQKFIKEYTSGKTPFPCAFCNPKIKFKHLNRLANELNCHFISTGHYARIVKKFGKRFVAKGVDKDKDQSFFLWGLNQNVVNRLIFPLGKYQKADVRRYAVKHGFYHISNKKDSLGICFINDGSYRSFLINNGVESMKGNFVDPNGKILGRHKGIVNYTIGQRKGLGLNVNKPLFVAELRPQKNEILLTDYQDLYKNNIYIRDVHFIDYELIDLKITYIVKVRYRLQETPCRLELTGENRIKLKLLEPLAMVANGQTAVIYDGERVLGGGFIEGSD